MILETLLATRELIRDRNNWTTGAYYERRGKRDCFCLVGAVEFAAGFLQIETDSDGVPFGSWPFFTDEEREKRDRALAAKGYLTDYAYRRTDLRMGLTAINDSGGHEMVIDLLDGAIESLQTP